MEPRGEAEAVLSKALNKANSSHRCTDGETLVMMLLFCYVAFASAQICIALPVPLTDRLFLSAFIFEVVFNIFLKLLLCRLGPFLGPNLGLFWELFRCFFDLKLRSYLKVVFSSIFHRIRAPLEPQKMRSRLGENQKIKILHFLS